MRIVAVIIAALAGLLFIGWLGFRFQPSPFPATPGEPDAVRTIPLLEGLPPPVDRYYRGLYGEQIPVIETAVLTGRATMAPVGGLKIPARFRFIHRAGHDYRHLFEMTWFGLPIGAGNEHYLGGASSLRLPMGLSDAGPQIDQAANLSLWAEYTWMPAVWLTDPRVRWEPVDGETALLVVPFAGDEQTFVARFDPATGKLAMLEAMRYKDSKTASKTLWQNVPGDWGVVGDYEIPQSGAVIWFDQGKPWAVFTVEDIALNVDVEEALHAGQE